VFAWPALQAMLIRFMAAAVRAVNRLRSTGAPHDRQPFAQANTGSR
jgi:hypothetical protein